MALHTEFVMHCGWEEGLTNWLQAECGDNVARHASTPAASQLTYVFCERYFIGFQNLTSFNRAVPADLNDSAEAKWTSDNTWKVLIETIGPGRTRRS